MEKQFKIINYETSEMAELSALPEYRSYALKWYYKRALSWARENVHYGYIGIGGKHRPYRGVHLYAYIGGEISYEIPLE